MTESANQTSLTPNFITDASGAVWTLVPTTAAGACRVCHNGVVMSNTSNVVQLLFYNSVVYHENTASNWYSWTKNSWVHTTNPLAAPPPPPPVVVVTESANGTTVTTAGPTIVDSALKTWTLVSSASSGMQIAVNGVVDPITAEVTLLLYYNHTVYQENSAGGWWSWTNSAWVGTTDPRVSAPSITGMALSNSTLTSGAATGTTVGTVTVSMSSGTFSGTLSVSGSSSFSMAGANVVTAAAISAGSYVVDVVATEPGAGGSPYTKAFAITVSGGSTVTPTAPAQAAAAGFNTLVFSDDFTSASTIATSQNQAYSPSINWYWGANVPGDVGSNSWTVLPTTLAANVGNGNAGGAGSNASPHGGILQFTSGSAFGAQLATVPGYVMTTVPPAGQGCWQHFYIEAYIQFNIAAKSASTSAGWVGYWSWSVEDAGGQGAGWWACPLTGSGGTASEIDFMESYAGLFSDPPGYWTSGMHQWSANNATSGASGTLKDSNWHTWGCLWTSTGNGTGEVTFYLDNVKQGSAIPTGTGQTQHSLETEHQYILLGTGAGVELNFDWVRIWQ